MLGLIVAVLLGLGLRLLDYASVFKSNGVWFPQPDAYYFLNSANHSVWGSILCHNEMAGAVISPMLFVGTCILVYVIGRSMFNRSAGIMAAIALAVWPGEYLGRTLLGCADYHGAEVFLTTGAMCCLVLCIKRLQWRYLLGAALFGLTYAMVWSGWMFFGAVMFIAFTAYIGLRLGGIWGFLIPIVVSVFAISGAFLIGGFAREVLRGTAEAGTAFRSLVLLNVLIAVIVGVVYVLRDKTIWRKALLGTWLFAFAALTLWQVRFDYYLVVPTALLLGAVLVSFVPVLKERMRIALLLCLLIPVLAYSLPMSVKELRSIDSFPSAEWQETLAWLRDNTPQDATIVVWWDYGYWISSKAKRHAVADNGQDRTSVELVADIFQSEALCPVGFAALPNNVYIVVDEVLIQDKMWAVELWTGKTVKTLNTFAYRLYNSEGWTDGCSFRHVYGSNIRIYIVERT